MRRARASLVAHATCGVMKQFFAKSSGLLGAAGDSPAVANIVESLKDEAVWLPNGKIESGDIAGGMALFEQVRSVAGTLKDRDVVVQLDGATVELNGETLVAVLRRIVGYVADKVHDGSIVYRYSIPYKQWRIVRWCRITDGRIDTTVDVYGSLFCQVDKPAVTTSSRHIRLRLLAQENDAGTLIRTTATIYVRQSYGARCRLVRRLSAKLGPAEAKPAIAAEIDTTMARFAGKVHTIADAGEAKTSLVTDWLDTLMP